MSREMMTCRSLSRALHITVGVFLTAAVYKARLCPTLMNEFKNSKSQSNTSHAADKNTSVGYWAFLSTARSDKHRQPILSDKVNECLSHIHE
jgi:hypothetical protein